MSVYDDIEELVNAGEIEIAKEIVMEDWNTRWDHLEDWEKIMWGHVDSTEEEWQEARQIHRDRRGW